MWPKTKCQNTGAKREPSSPPGKEKWLRSREEANLCLQEFSHGATSLESQPSAYLLPCLQGTCLMVLYLAKPYGGVTLESPSKPLAGKGHPKFSTSALTSFCLSIEIHPQQTTACRAPSESLRLE